MPQGAQAGPLSVVVDTSALEPVSRALRAEARGGELRTDLRRNLNAAAKPLVTDLRSKISAAGTGKSSPSITRSIASAIKPVVRTTGKDAGVFVVVGKISTRGFRGAPKAFNSRSWRHPVYGGKWVTQRSRAPGWFDKTSAAHRPQFERATRDAIAEMAERIAQRSKGN